MRRVVNAKLHFQAHGDFTMGSTCVNGELRMHNTLLTHQQVHTVTKCVAGIYLFMVA